jgi:hypothetical protein
LKGQIAGDLDFVVGNCYYLFVRTVFVVRAGCSGFRLYFCVIIIFIYESSAHGEDRLQAIYTIFVCDCDIYL